MRGCWLVFAAALCLIHLSSQHRDAPCQSICKMAVERSKRAENGVMEETWGELGEQRRVRRLGF